MTELIKQPVNILMADDDEDDVLLFSTAASESGIDIKLQSVSDGNQLMELLKEQNIHPDYIFLDINMPRKNGKECLREIRNDGRYTTVPVIIYTTSAYKNDIEETYRYGASMYVIKGNSVSDDKKVIVKVIRENKDQILRLPKSDFVHFAQSL